MIGLLHLFCDGEKEDMHCKPREVTIKKPGVLSCKDLDLPGDSNWPRAAFDRLTKKSGWWFQIFFIFIPIAGVSWSNMTSILFRWVGSTTNQKNVGSGLLRDIFWVWQTSALLENPPQPICIATKPVVGWGIPLDVGGLKLDVVSGSMEQRAKSVFFAAMERFGPLLESMYDEHDRDETVCVAEAYLLQGSADGATYSREQYEKIVDDSRRTSEERPGKKGAWACAPHGILAAALACPPVATVSGTTKPEPEEKYRVVPRKHSGFRNGTPWKKLTWT